MRCDFSEHCNEKEVQASESMFGLNALNVVLWLIVDSNIAKESDIRIDVKLAIGAIEMDVTSLVVVFASIRESSIACSCWVNQIS